MKLEQSVVRAAALDRSDRNVMTRTWALAAAATTILALSSCAYDSGDEDDPSSDGPSETTTTSMPAPAGEPVLGLGATRLGDIVVDDSKMSVYVYDQDEVGGPSRCEGSCLNSWEPVTTDSQSPQVDGIDAAIATIPAGDGAFQITVNGRPVYRYADDERPGDVLGQDLDSVWWLLDPVGNPILQPPA